MNQPPWSLKLFLSADLVGSTACKGPMRREETSPPTWPNLFREFYTHFILLFTNQYRQHPDFVQSDVSVPPVWKTLGDEILFVVELSDYRHALTHVVALKEAIKRFDETWAGKSLLRLKGTAWIAGFPISNVEIELPMDDTRGQKFDYIGPSIDTGFRLSKFSTDRRLCLAVDLVVMLLDALSASRSNELSFFYEGRHPLKGVLADRPYPVIWLDVLDGKPDLEESLLGTAKQKCPVNDLVRFVDEFLTSDSGVRMPFIERDKGARYATVPEWAVSVRDKINKSTAAYHEGEQERNAMSTTPQDQLKVSELIRESPLPQAMATDPPSAEEVKQKV